MVEVEVEVMGGHDIVRMLERGGWEKHTGAYRGIKKPLLCIHNKWIPPSGIDRYM